MNYIKNLLPWRIWIFRNNSGDTSHLFLKTCGKMRNYHLKHTIMLYKGEK